MSVLGSLLTTFLTTWSHARLTFGDGNPEPGGSFDSSATLRRLEADTRSASASPAWSGPAADAYGAQNTARAATLARMADLDRRMGAEVDRSAAVVVDGRRKLDSVRDWVLTAARSVPETAAGEQMLLPIVGQGCADIAEIITSSNGELAAIAARIRALGAEYATAGPATPPSAATTSDPRTPTMPRR